MKPAILLIVFFPILIAGCSSNDLYRDKVDFPDESWNVQEEPEFTFEIEDTTILYDVHYLIRNTNDYPYYNLYLTYFLKDSLGSTLGKQLQEIHLVDQKSGKPLGSGFGGIKDHEILGIKGFKFPKKGRHYFKVKHYMRQDKLPGILSFGIKILPQEK